MRGIRRSQVAGLLVAHGKLLPWRILLCFFCALLLSTVSACSFDDTTAYRAAPPPTAAEKTKPLDSIAALPTAMDTFRALAPSEGLKFTPLFAEPLKDTDARLKRLEDAVQSMRNDFDTVVPTMVRMVAIEKDIKGLVAQLQTLTDQSQGQNPAAPGTTTTPTSTPENSAPAKSGANPIPGEDKAQAKSSLVTPEAASKGELPPEGAASPNSTAPVDLTKPPPLKPALNQAPQALPPAKSGANPIPGEDAAQAKSSLVTPEAASKGELPPEGAASPYSLKLPGFVVPQAEKKTEAAPPPPSGPVLGDVSNVRIADHADKTRLVLDITVKSGGPAKIENNGKTLVIPLTQLNWTGKKSWDAVSAQLISGYHIAEGNLYVDLMYASQLQKQLLLPPIPGNNHYRLMIDLFSPEVHKP